MNVILDIITELTLNKKNSFSNLKKERAGLAADIQADFLKKLTLINMKRMVPLLIFLLVIEISNMIVDTLSLTHASFQPLYIYGNYFLLFLAIVYLVLINFAFTPNEKNLLFLSFIYHSFWWLFSTGVLFFAILDLLECGTLFNFVILLIVLAIVPIAKMQEIIAVSFYAVTVVCIAIIRLGLPVYLIQQAIIMGIATVIFSQNFYCTFFSSFLSQKKLELSNRKLAQLAETDALTNLLNRRGADKRITKLLNKNIQTENGVVLMILDIDLFKLYNDTFGHEQGDLCLQNVSNFLQETLKNATNIISRYGGEEFLIMLGEMPKEDILTLAQKIRRGIEEIGIAASCSVANTVTISMGIASLPAGGCKSFRELFAEADDALYQAKTNGRNCISYQNQIYR